MQRRLTNYATFFMMFIFFASLIGCEKPIELSSRWRDFEIMIDGIDDEWGGATIYAAKEKVSLTMLNDSNYMYINLHTRDRSVQAQVLGMGFTIWFVSDGGNNKTFGIRFPLGKQDMGDMGMPMITRGGMQNAENLERMLEKSMDEMEIIGPGKDEIYRMSLIEAETQGINAMLGFSKGNLIYELKVPFVHDDDHLFAIGLNAAEIDTNITIGIGFETPEIDMEEMKKNMKEKGSGMPPGGRPSGGMPGGGMRGGGMRGGPEMPERLQLWTIVKLANE